MQRKDEKLQSSVAVLKKSFKRKSKKTVKDRNKNSL